MSTMPPRVSYLSDDVVPAYNDALNAATDRKRLLAYLQEWRDFAPDGLAVVKGIRTPADFEEWRRGLDAERKGTFAGEEWASRFGALLMPERMMRASMVASQFMVPWGTAWIRLKEEGLLDGERR